MNWRDLAAISDIVHAANIIVDITGNSSEEAFEYDYIVSSSVLYQLVVIGEATKRLSQEFRDQNPDIPWRDMARLRDFVVHVYDQVDLNRIWQTAVEHVPPLIPRLEPLLPPKPDGI